MQTVYIATQIVLSAVLTGLILVQARGTGMSRAFGGNGVSFSRRGVERVMFKSTFVIAGLFILVSMLSLAL